MSPWGSDYVCNESNFTNKTGSAPFAPSNSVPTYANQSWTEIWKDELTGMYITNFLHTSGGGSDWFMASALCSGLDSLNGASGGTGWRLPTQKALFQLYIDGISKVPLAGKSTDTIWTSTASSIGAHNVWASYLDMGVPSSYGRNTVTNSVICVR